MLHPLKLRASLLVPAGLLNCLSNPLSGIEDAIIQHVRYHIVPNLEEQAVEQGREPLAKPGLAP